MREGRERRKVLGGKGERKENLIGGGEGMMGRDGKEGKRKKKRDRRRGRG